MLDFVRMDDNAVQALISVLNHRDRTESRLAMVCRRWLTTGEETTMTALIGGLSELPDDRQAEIRRRLQQYEDWSRYE